jgi:DnaJ family protein C protein 28
MKEFSRSIDEQIKKAIQEGAFDDLPGKGEPLDLTANPHEDPGWSLAYHMLRSSGFTLPWIETRQTIEAEYTAAVEALARTWTWRETALEQDQAPTDVESEWRRALQTFKTKVAELNKRIFNYNLQVPADQFKRRQINLEREIARITGQVD